MAETLKGRLIEQLDRLQSEPLDQLLEKRFERLMSYGK